MNIGNTFRGIEKPQTTRVSENQGCEEASDKCTGLRNEMSVLCGVSMFVKSDREIIYLCLLNEKKDFDGISSKDAV